MWIVLGFLSLCLSLSVGEMSGDFCDADLCLGGARHIACNQDTSFQSTCPPGAQTVFITPALMALILKTHNQLRSRLAVGSLPGFSSASKMLEVKWDKTLAYVAGFNARRCVMEHDACRNTHAFLYSGQNLGILEQTNEYVSHVKTITKLINMWYDEFPLCPRAIIENYRKSTDSQVEYGHFTQLVQDRADRVGCALVRFVSEGWYSSYLVCNYSWANILGQSVYVEGRPCSGCPEQCSEQFAGLCTGNSTDFT